MKDIVRLVVRFILSFAAVLILLVAGIVAVRWVTYQTPTSVSVGRALAYTTVQAFRPSLLPATIAAALVCLFGLLKFSRARPLGLVTVLILTAAALTFGGWGLELLGGTVAAPGQPRSHRIEPDVLYRTDVADFYALRRVGLELSGVVVHQPEAEPAFRVVGEAIRDPMRREIHIPETGMTIPTAAVQNAYWQAFVPPPVAAGTFADVARAGAAFDGPFQPVSRGFLILAGSLALVITSLWVLVRISRWPLLNILLALGMVRALFAGFRLAAAETVREFAAIVVPPQLMSYLLPVIFAAVALVLLLILVLMPPYQQWKREVVGG